MCLDVRKGKKLDGFIHEQRDEDECLACIDPPARNQPGDAMLISERLGWKRVLGLYNVPRRAFR